MFFLPPISLLGSPFSGRNISFNCPSYAPHIHIHPVRRNSGIRSCTWLCWIRVKDEAIMKNILSVNYTR